MYNCAWNILDKSSAGLNYHESGAKSVLLVYALYLMCVLYNKHIIVPHVLMHIVAYVISVISYLGPNKRNFMLLLTRKQFYNISNSCKKLSEKV